MDNTLGKRIQRLRIERSHTQVELGRRIGETLDTINKIETGKMEVYRFGNWRYYRVH